MKKTIKNLSSWSMCLLLVFGLSISSYGSVLCIGADDHIKVESVCQPCCNTASQECGSVTRALNHSEHEGCVNCIDIDLFQEILRRIPTQTVGGADVHVFYSAAFTAILSNFQGTHHRTPPHRKSAVGTFAYLPTCINLASTVIRC